jgi:hypothetical protein
LRRVIREAVVVVPMATLDRFQAEARHSRKRQPQWQRSTRSSDFRTSLIPRSGLTGNQDASLAYVRWRTDPRP